MEPIDTAHLSKHDQRTHSSIIIFIFKFFEWLCFASHTPRHNSIRPSDENTFNWTKCIIITYINMLMCVDRTSLRWMDRIWWVLVNIVVGDGGYVHCGHLTCSMLVLIVRTALYCLDRPRARPWLRIRCVWTEDIFLIWSFLDRRWGKRKGLLVWSGRHGQFMGQNGNMGTFQCWCVRCANMRVCGLQFTFETISDMSWIAALLIVYVIPFFLFFILSFIHSFIQSFIANRLDNL